VVTWRCRLGESKIGEKTRREPTEKLKRLLAYMGISNPEEVRTEGDLTTTLFRDNSGKLYIGRYLIACRDVTTGMEKLWLEQLQVGEALKRCKKVAVYKRVFFGSDVEGYPTVLFTYVESSAT